MIKGHIQFMADTLRRIYEFIITLRIKPDCYKEVVWNSVLKLNTIVWDGVQHTTECSRTFPWNFVGTAAWSFSLYVASEMSAIPILESLYMNCIFFSLSGGFLQIFSLSWMFWNFKRMCLKIGFFLFMFLDTNCTLPV